MAEVRIPKAFYDDLTITHYRIVRPAPSAPVVEETVKRISPSDMTLRDWFAGQALAGILANSEGMRSVLPQFNPQASEHPYAPAYRNDIGATAYDIADAMIRARQIGEAMEGK